MVRPGEDFWVELDEVEGTGSGTTGGGGLAIKSVRTLEVSKYQTPIDLEG